MAKSQFNININRDDPTLNDYLSSWSSFGSRPSKIVIYNTYSYPEFIKIIKPSNDRVVLTEIIPSDDSSMINDKVYDKINDDLCVSYIVIDRTSESPVVNELTFYYIGDGSKAVNDIVTKLNDCLSDDSISTISKLNTILIGQNGLELEPISQMKIDSDNIEMYYNGDTLKCVNKLIKKIKKTNKGLSILYGERGSGKTSIINYISDNIDRLVIFIPNNMMEHTINNPEFRRFLKKWSNPIVVIDDCEIFFNEVYTKSNIFTSNLLQLVDGFLSDSIDVHIVTLFNVGCEEDIDHSLLNCNGLIDVIKFENLDKDESSLLGKHIGHDGKYKSSNRLIDIIKKRRSKAIQEIGL